MAVAEAPNAAPVKQLRAIKGDPDAQFDVPVLKEGEDFRPAERLEEIVKGLINRFRDRFSSLDSLRIRVFWVNHGRTAHGKPILGQAKRPNKIWHHFLEHDVDYILFVAADHCRTQQMTNYACEALLFRLLCQCFVDEEGKLTILDYDFQGFVAELNAYGPWTEDLKIGARAFRNSPIQLSLDDVEGDDDDDEAGE